MEFETATASVGKFFVVGELARTSGLKSKEVLFWEFANGAAAGVGKV